MREAGQPPEPEREGSDRALLLERAAAGLAHEGKNPLHTMALHLHLLADKLAKAGADRGVERHAQALRDGIGKVDALLRAFAEMAAPQHVEADLGKALERAMLLFAYEVRRGGGTVGDWSGPRSARVEAPGGAVNELVTHAFLAALAFSRGGGSIVPELRNDEARAELVLRSEEGTALPEEAAPHLDAVRRLAREAGAELSIAAPSVGSARLSISLPRAR